MPRVWIALRAHGFFPFSWCHEELKASAHPKEGFREGQVVHPTGGIPGAGFRYCQYQYGQDFFRVEAG